MLLDLVSPWAAAVGANDNAARAAFLTRNATLLDHLRRQRAPDHAALGLATDTRPLLDLARRATDQALQLLLTDVVDRAAALGADVPVVVTLLAGDGRGDIVEPLPQMDPAAVALFVEHAGSHDDAASLLAAGLARGVALVTRWRAADSASALRRASSVPWDRWVLSRDVPLGEWIYADGVATRLAHEVEPSLPLHRLLGVSTSALSRLRETERALRARLAEDLPRAGLGPVLRWMVPDAPASARTIDGHVTPSGAGRYLGWRLTAERVNKVGIRAAIRGAI